MAAIHSLTSDAGRHATRVSTLEARRAPSAAHLSPARVVASNKASRVFIGRRVFAASLNVKDLLWRRGLTVWAIDEGQRRSTAHPLPAHYDEPYITWSCPAACDAAQLHAWFDHCH